MSKKTITGEDGKTYNVKEKKAWYKKWWVWIIAIVLIIIIGGALGSGNDSSSNNNSSATKSSSKSSLKKSYKVGESATYKGYSFKVNSVKYWDGDNDMDTPKSGNEFVIVNVTITNKGDEKQDYNSYDFKLNSDGNSTDFDEILTNDEYSKDVLDSGTLDKGATVSGNLIGQAKKDSKLKLEYKPSFFDDKTIDVPLN
ncbi:DUF4352 domain-containing protein [Pediococcus pentosaceus]|uniref:DUF4352 domain-containing protein n=1 Tax=Pediococcus pentosaceus TaxID=1255 RepID=UPI002FF395F1